MLTVTLSEGSPFVASLIHEGLFGLLGYSLRQKFTVSYGLSSRARKKRMILKTVNIVASLLLFVALPYSAATDRPVPTLGNLVLLALSIVFLIYAHRPIYILKVIAGELWIAGASKKYLDQVKKDADN